MLPDPRDVEILARAQAVEAEMQGFENLLIPALIGLDREIPEIPIEGKNLKLWLHVIRDLVAAEARLTVVREALETYGKHKQECRLVHRHAAVLDLGPNLELRGLRSPNPEEVAAVKCTCGFDAALRVDPQPSHVKETNDDQARVAGQCDPSAVVPQRAEE